MGQGMADFIKKDVKTIADFDLYCHYVAGLVGFGLTRLFYAYKPSSITIVDSDEVSNSMGLFLQKTNIIRDYHEDLFSERSFWPREIWGAHVENLNHLAINPGNPESLETLNHMVADALRHVPDCLEYLNNVKDKKIFNFTAVPQIMAVATLAKLYNNPKVLKGVVKVRKGLAARLMIYNVTLNDVYKYFRKSVRAIEKKNQPGTPYYKETRQVLKSIKSSLNKRLI
jgi:farnesyl-diphosphate farnesyltransferase